MGLSPLLVDTYRRYKRDTKTFTQWLGSTARSTGLVEDAFEDGSAKKSASVEGRKKSHNRKAWKQATAYKISVNDFIPLANAIKDAEFSKVPRHILSVLGDIIQARKGCAAWYRAHLTKESDTMKSHNEGHRHIIVVLEDVYQVLLPLRETMEAKIKKNTNCSTPSPNLFSLLEVEECPDWEDGVPSKAGMPKKVVQDSYEPEAAPEDVSFAMYCFMKDLTDIRIFIRRTWREYKHGQITLNSAAVTSNTAMSVIYHLSEGFIEAYPQFAEHRSLIDYLQAGSVDPNATADRVNQGEAFASYQGEGVQLSSKTFFCDHTTAVLATFYREGAFPMYPRYMMANMQGVTEDEHILLQCLSHLNIVDWHLNGMKHKGIWNEIFLEDQVLRAVRTMRLERKFPTWVVFACQILVDTRREIGTQLGEGLQDLRTHESWLSEV
jgi:hypothetical protein